MFKRFSGFTLLDSKHLTGFTLVELLVVIAVIGVLAVMIIISVAGSRAKSVDGKVKRDLAELQKTIPQCANDDGNPAIINDSNNTAIGDNVCDLPEVSLTWPDLTSLGKGTSGNVWDWETSTIDYDSTTGNFSFSASSGGNTFTCDQNGCQ